MKLLKRTALVFSLFIITCATASAQTFADDARAWADGWKYAFSQEGRQNWRPEFTARWTSGFFTTGPEITGGVRIDDKRTFGLLVGQGDLYIDKYPSHVYSITTAAYMRRYFHFGKKDIFALYSDAAIGARILYKVDGEAGYNPGEVWFYGAWEPGMRFRFWRNVHLFLGPTIATDCIGLHLGVGF